MAKGRKNCPKDSEITIGEWLDQIGATKKFVGGEGEGPPDWEIQYKGEMIAVEVTLMYDTGGWGRTKKGRTREKAFEREIRRLIEEVSREGGPKWHVLCEYDPRVPVLMAPFAILTAEEGTEIDARVRECDVRQQWSKIVMVSRFQTRCDGSQEKWFYAPWEDPRHPSLPESPSPKVVRL